MKASRLQICPAPPIKELQGMITTGETGRASSLEVLDSGTFKVRLKTGETWIASSVGIACLVEETPTATIPPTNPATVQRSGGKR